MNVSTQFKHELLETIDGDGYDKYPFNERSKREFLRDTFESEFGWRVDQVGRANAIQEWAQGLPSAVSFPFMNHDIMQLGIKYGALSDDSTDKAIDKYIDQYWSQYLPGALNSLMYGTASTGYDKNRSE